MAESSGDNRNELMMKRFHNCMDAMQIAIRGISIMKGEVIIDEEYTIDYLCRHFEHFHVDKCSMHPALLATIIETMENTEHYNVISNLLLMLEYSFPEFVNDKIAEIANSFTLRKKVKSKERAFINYKKSVLDYMYIYRDKYGHICMLGKHPNHICTSNRLLSIFSDGVDPEKNLKHQSIKPITGTRNNDILAPD